MVLAEVANVADWIAAIGQAAGALFTAGAVGVALWLGWRDRRWRHADQADREAAQARLITVEVTPCVGTHTRPALIVGIRNDSGSPIFDAEIVDVFPGEMSPLPWHYDEAASGPESPPAIRRVVPTKLSHMVVVFYRDPTSGTPIRPDVEHSAVVRYTDANGLRWTRRDNAAPVRLVEAE